MASSLTGLALLALTGCGESVSNRLMAPSDGPLAGRSGSAPVRGLTSSAGVVPTAYDGNTNGEGGAACSALGFGPTGTKVDGAFSQKIAGYQFTVSGGSKQFLAFAPTGGTPTSVILAVIVKGADGYDVYDYRNNLRTSDAGLTAPYKNGDLPTISHYVVCYGPRPVTPPVFTKKLVGVMKEGATVGSMEPDPTWPAHPDLVVIPIGSTRWLEWELNYTLPPGVTGTITENATTVCGSLGDFILQCSFNENPVTYPIYTWSGLSGTGVVPVMTDLGGGGGGSCGDHQFTNTATLTPLVGAPITVSKTITVRVVCAPASTINKELVRVWKQGATIGSMVPDPAWTPGSNLVTIPIGETRWLDYDVSYTLPSGVTGTITEDSREVCGTLDSFILQCSFNLAPTSTGVYSWSVTSGGTPVTVPIDLGGGGGGSCGDHVFTNTARLTPSTGSVATATKTITVRVVCPPKP